MKKILFLHPPLDIESRYGESKKFTGHIHPPQGLCHLASVLDNKYECHILDAQALFMGIQDTVKLIEDLRPDYIGIITFTIAMSNIHKICLELSDIIPSARIIIGGPHITACPEETFRRYHLFNLGILGEGEDTLIELISCLEEKGDLSKVNGIIYKNEEGLIIRTAPRLNTVKLAMLPRPRWDLLPHLPSYYRPSTMTYIKLPAVAVVTSRGCPGRCVFCDRSVFGRQWRAHPAEQVLDWIDYLVDKFGISDLNFQDDHFMVDKTRLKGICEGIQRKHPDLVWSAIARVDSITQESIDMMLAAGCWQLAFGFESGSQAILDNLKKGTSVEKSLQTAKMCKEAGLKIKGLFMAGCPGETEETLKQTIRFIHELNLDFLSISAFTPIPNTEIYSEWEKWGRWEGASPDDWDKMNLWEPIFLANGLTKEIIKKYIQRAAVSK